MVLLALERDVRTRLSDCQRVLRMQQLRLPRARSRRGAKDRLERDCELGSSARLRVQGPTSTTQASRNVVDVDLLHVAGVRSVECGAELGQLEHAEAGVARALHALDVDHVAGGTSSPEIASSCLRGASFIRAYRARLLSSSRFRCPSYLGRRSNRSAPSAVAPARIRSSSAIRGGPPGSAGGSMLMRVAWASAIASSSTRRLRRTYNPTMFRASARSRAVTGASSAKTAWMNSWSSVGLSANGPYCRPTSRRPVKPCFSASPPTHHGSSDESPASTCSQLNRINAPLGSSGTDGRLARRRCGRGRPAGRR